ncbi:hypothetical protein ACFQT0_31285 [Hymenobacter humi]|uniref:Uncharacterized protein n=1 Tax=Hymenobacter humi TaxID=1411620 RepID=A0ABW2UGJ6_9BACT
MSSALSQLEAFEDDDFEGRLVRRANPWKIAVVLNGYSVAWIALTPAEGAYLTHVLKHPEQLRPLVYFRLALQQGTWSPN